MIEADPIAGDVVYGALHSGAVFFRSDRRWSRMEGAKASEALNGLVTNDVLSMASHSVVLAAALTPKGKLMCDMLVFRAAEDTFLVGVDPLAFDAWIALTRKYVNPRLARITDEGDGCDALVLAGPDAGRVAASVAESVLTSALPYAIDAHLLLGTASSLTELIPRLEAAGSARGTDALWTVARVEAGIPQWGLDMDEQTIPQEANLDALGAISFTKGCYTGQETVARIHFRGHVNRQLRGLCGDVPFVFGASVSDSAGKTVGDVRSVATSPVRGPLALAMLRREVQPGDMVSVAQDGRIVSALVTELPFAR